MVLIGNDLLFLAHNKQTFSRINAHRIILNNSEKSFFAETDNCNSLSIAWTIKESIYKILCKKGHSSAFSPRSITITKLDNSNNKISGKAIFEKTNYYFHSEINKKFIYTYASDCLDILPKIEHHFFNNNISNNSSLSNQEFLRFINHNNWQLTHTENGFPIISNCNSPLDISLTHDYNLMAFCEYHNK